MPAVPRRDGDARPTSAATSGGDREEPSTKVSVRLPNSTYLCQALVLAVDRDEGALGAPRPGGAAEAGAGEPHDRAGHDDRAICATRLAT